MQELKTFIGAVTLGNPLFIREVSRTLQGIKNSINIIWIQEGFKGGLL